MPEPGAREALYRTLVVERARRPLHAGEVADADGRGQGVNPLCGDRVGVSLRRDADGRIGALRHGTEGCAICAAAADLLADSVCGLQREQVLALWRDFERLLRDGPAALPAAERDRLGLLNAFADLHEYRSRRKCATLPWSALLAALDGGERA